MNATLLHILLSKKAVKGTGTKSTRANGNGGYGIMADNLRVLWLLMSFFDCQ